MLLQNKKPTLFQSIKNIFKYVPKFQKNRPNQNILIILEPLFRLFTSFAAIFLLYFIDFLPGQVNGGGFSLFIFAIVTLNIGYFIHKDLADRLFDTKSLKGLSYIGVMSLLFSFSVAISKEFILFWPLFFIHLVAALHCTLIYILPPLIKPIETQEYLAKRHYLIVLNGKYNGFTKEQSELCWNDYQNKVRNTALFINHSIPKNKCFDPLSMDERNAIIEHAAWMIAFFRNSN
jgi:hypothetical protein